MKYIVTFALLLFVPTTSLAYFKDTTDMEYAEPSYYSVPPVMEEMEEVDRSERRVLRSLPGWPSWVGRLDVFSIYFYNAEFDYLDEATKGDVQKMSQGWPNWVGVPAAPVDLQ